jgi:hypothetical protein
MFKAFLSAINKPPKTKGLLKKSLFESTVKIVHAKDAKSKTQSSQRKHCQQKIITQSRMPASRQAGAQ